MAWHADDVEIEVQVQVETEHRDRRSRRRRQSTMSSLTRWRPTTAVGPESDERR